VATFKKISASGIKTARSSLNQLIDIIQEDISGSTTRKKYQVFVTGGVGPGVTSSLFQTVFDQNYTLQTANPILDMTVGLFVSGQAAMSNSTGIDSAGKRLYPSRTLMMREKTNIYRQYAQSLLGNADTVFQIPFAGSSQKNIDQAMFINFKRLFARDAIKKESFAMRMYATACIDVQDTITVGGAAAGPRYTNINRTTVSGSKIWTDVGASTDTFSAYGGTVANIVDSSDTSVYGGLLFYDQGILMMDLDRCISGSQHISGVIGALCPNAGQGTAIGQMMIGGEESQNSEATFIPDLMVSASIDDIVEHLASCRFSSGTLTALTFQNITEINSTLIFCRATADEFNYSGNPTFIDTDNNIRVIDTGQEAIQRTFSFITTVGLYDSNNNLLAVAKLSRPVEKNDEKDLTIRIRLDF